MAWSIRSESAPLTLDWYLSLHLTPSEIARVKRRRDWGEIQAALIDGIRQMDPTAARALARRQGLLPALTDRQHTAVVRHTAQKPAQARSNPRRRPNTARAMQELQGRLGALLDRSRNPYRANGFKLRTDIRQSWQDKLKTYESNDLVVIATRETLQNSVDAIRKAVKASLLKKGEGRFDVNWRQEPNGSLTFEWVDNGIGMAKKPWVPGMPAKDMERAVSVMYKFTELYASPKREEAEGARRRGREPEISLTIRKMPRPASDPFGSYWFRLNGLLQFRSAPVRGGNLKDDYIFDYKTTGNTGGFGVAKAVILAISESMNAVIYSKNWKLQVKREDEMEIVPSDLPSVDGTRIVVYDVPVHPIDSSGEQIKYINYLSMENAVGEKEDLNTRLRTMLSANDLPDIQLYLNGVKVRQVMPKEKGRTVSLPRNVNSNSPVYGVSRADFGSSAIPGSSGYPFHDGRDRLKGGPKKALSKFAAIAEKDEGGTGNIDPKKDEVYDPGAEEWQFAGDEKALKKHQKRKQELEHMAESLGAGINDPSLQESIRNASATMVSYFEEATAMVHPEAVEEKSALPGSAGSPMVKIIPAGAMPEGAVTMGGSGELDLSVEEVAGTAENEVDRAATKAEKIEAMRGAAKEIAQNLLDSLSADDEAAPNDILDRYSKEALKGIASTGEVGKYDVDALGDILGAAKVQAEGKGGGGLAQILPIQQAISQLVDKAIPADRRASDAKKATKKSLRFNPFGDMAGLIIQKGFFLDKNGKYDATKASSFKKNYANWLPWLILWDNILRLVTTKARIDIPYKPGFVLNNSVLAMYWQFPSGVRCVFVNPFTMRDAAKGYKGDPVSFANYLLSLAVHELTHMEMGTLHFREGQDYTGKMARVETHGNNFTVRREELGVWTAPFVPVIAALVTNYLDPIRGISMSMPPDKRVKKATKQIKKLEKQFARQRTKYTKQIDMLKAQSKVSCKTCYADLLKVLDGDGRLDTLDWLNIKTGR